jgi:hypothetical protein
LAEEVSLVNRKKVLANLNWIPYERGGRATLVPRGMRFYPLLVVEGSENDENCWTGIVKNISVEGRASKAEMEFLVDDAPHHLLISGARFSLFDGETFFVEGVVEFGVEVGEVQ